MADGKHGVSHSRMQNSIQKSVLSHLQRELHQMNWSPTAIGRLLAPSPQWQLSINGDQYELSVEGKTSRGGLLDLDGLVITKGLLWCRLVVPQGSGQSVVLGGLPNRDGNELRSSIEQGISRVRRKRTVNPC